MRSAVYHLSAYILHKMALNTLHSAATEEHQKYPVIIAFLRI